jgi:hypothetical protein
MKQAETKMLVINILTVAAFLFVGSAIAAKGGNKPPKPGGGNDCNLEFDAVFRDGVTPKDGLVSDGQGSYVANGGTGFRLDTNGSIKLEKRNDTRFVWVDFSAANVCDDNNNFAPAGFCKSLKGIDLRFEHQVQDPDMCPLVIDESTDMVIRVGFEAEPGRTLLNGDSDSGSGVTAFSLSYGCVGPRLDPLDAYDPGVVTKTGEHSWTIEGFTACLHTNLGNILKDSNGEVVYLDMPFLISITDVNSP